MTRWDRQKLAAEIDPAEFQVNTWRNNLRPGWSILPLLIQNIDQLRHQLAEKKA